MAAYCLNVSIRRVNELKLNRVDIVVVHKKSRNDVPMRSCPTRTLPARQHLRLNGYILYTAFESQKRQEWDSLGLLSK